MIQTAVCVDLAWPHGGLFSAQCWRRGKAAAACTTPWIMIHQPLGGARGPSQRHPHIADESRFLKDKAERELAGSLPA